MKLLRIKLEQFRQFRHPVEVHLEDGINLFVGPNESGKSTLADGLRAAFFERHSSTALTGLQPWGDSGAAPQVEVDFLWQDETWRLRKRFLRRQRADLSIGSQSFSGTEAEDRLAELLGYQFPGRGASKPEQHGIPGLLWIEQGTSQAVTEAAGFASDYLQAALGGALGDLASSSGDRLLQRAEDERAALLTKSGTPRADYKVSLDEQKQLETELTALNDRIDRYRQRVDELERELRQQREVDATEPWREQLELARQAQARLQEVGALEQQSERLQAELEHCAEQIKSRRRELQQFEEEERNLLDRERARDAATAELEALKARESRLTSELAAAKRAFTAATEQRKQAERKGEHDELTARQRQLQEQLRERTEALQIARRLAKTLQQQKKSLQALQVDEQALAALRSCEEQLRELHIQQQTLATRVSWQLDPGQHITLDGTDITDTGETLLLEEAELLLPGLGRLQLQPGGTDVARLARDQQSLHTERQRLLDRLGTDSLAAADERAKQAAQLAGDIGLAQRELDTRAPQGLQDLETTLDLATKELEALSAKLNDLPTPPADALPLDKARAAEQQARQTLDELEQQRIELAQSLARADAAHEAADKEWQGLQQRLSSSERQSRQQTVHDQLKKLAAQEGQLSKNLASAQEAIAAAQPELLRQDAERHESSAASLQQAAQHRRERISELRGQLGESGNLNLEEQAAEVEQALERTRRRNQQLARRAAALDLLLKLLRAKRQELTDRLLAPLQTGLKHYLRLLQPGIRLSVGDNLVPLGFQRSGGNGVEQDQLDALSFGAREQIGVICRLAYADLLRDAGKPTLLILDDALVHTDEQRLQQMKRILFDARQRHQILIFSCHAQNWTDLGVTPIDLQALKAAA